VHWAGSLGLKATAVQFPTGDPLLEKATMPEGWAPEAAVTVAVTVGAPGQVLRPLSPEASVVVVPEAATVCDRGALAEELSLADELVKNALRLWVAACSEEMLHAAVPPEVVTALQSVAVPSKKVTVPLGVPAADVMVAVNVSTDPKVPGVGSADSVVNVAAGVMDSVWIPCVNPALEGGDVSDTVIVGDPALVSP
jgi:hypothetical protein